MLHCDHAAASCFQYCMSTRVILQNEKYASIFHLDKFCYILQIFGMQKYILEKHEPRLRC